MTNMPVISVLMAAHNAQRWLRLSIDSILNQTLPEFEVVVVDDGSTDGTLEILRDYSLRDSRVKILDLPKKVGLARALNLGLSQCRGAFVARMDADDIAHPRRLEIQLEYLRSHPDIGIVGSQAITIDATGKKQGLVLMPCEPAAVKWHSIISNPFIHPSVMFLRSLLEENECTYDPELNSAQDYDLWSRLLAAASGANLSRPLLLYRVSDASITSQRRTEQLANHARISNQQALRLLGDTAPSPGELSLLRDVFVWAAEGGKLSPQDRIQGMRKLFELSQAFQKQCDGVKSRRSVRYDTALAALRAVGNGAKSLGYLAAVFKCEPMLPLFVAERLLHRRRVLHDYADWS